MSASNVARSFMKLPRAVGQMFHEMTQAHMAFLRGNAMSNQQQAVQGR